MPPRDDADEIKARLNESLEQMLERFWPGYVKRGKIAYCTPVNARDVGSFQVYLGQMGKYTRGRWVRSSAGIGGDELNLFAYGLTGNHRATAEVFRAAKEFVGMETGRQETSEERERRESMRAAAEAKREADDRRAREHEIQRTRTAAEIWAESVPIAGTHAEAYLFARGIPVPPEGWGTSLRFHPRLKYDLDEKFFAPALVCRVDDCTGDLTAVWRIFLDPKKPSKAAVPNAKLGLGVAAGGAVRLGGIAAQIGIAEGVESALGARALTKYRFPVFAGLSTSGMAGFEVPMEVEAVRIFPDGDRPWRRQDGDIVNSEPAGRAAARKLKARLDAIGTPALIERQPPIGNDYLDLWVRRCRAEVPA